MEKMMEKWGGGEVLRRAVRGMLPKNRLRDDRMARLKCMYDTGRGQRGAGIQKHERIADCVIGFEGAAHPYEENILKLGAQSSISQTPEVRAAFEPQQPQQ